MNSSAEVDLFPVKTEAFEGPLELLLELVEKRKLLINDISLAKVTDEYMERVSYMQRQSLPNSIYFVQLASTLLLIKSKSLLPILDLSSDEEEVIDDLEIKLRRYAIFREISKGIEERFGKNILHERQYVPNKKPLFVTDKFTTVENLRQAIYDVLQNLPQKIEQPRVRVKKIISLEEMIERLEKRVKEQMNLRFSELLDNDRERPLIIVGFLAILESVKQGSVLVAQSEHFADIEISIEQTNTPRYH